MKDNGPQRHSRSYLLPVEDTEFLLRDEMRMIRFALEYSKAELSLRDHGIESTIVVFGSARIPSPEQAETYVNAEVRLEVLKANNETAQILDFSGDLALFAANLYSSLRQADAQGIRVVVAVLPPAIGLGVAIRDRLSKASQATS